MNSCLAAIFGLPYYLKNEEVVSVAAQEHAHALQRRAMSMMAHDLNALRSDQPLGRHSYEWAMLQWVRGGNGTMGRIHPFVRNQEQDGVDFDMVLASCPDDDALNEKALEYARAHREYPYLHPKLIATMIYGAG